jgi:hypothetical protein
VEPKDDGLRTTAEVIRQNVAADVDVYVNVNNHYEECGPLTVRRLVGILREEQARQCSHLGFANDLRTRTPYPVGSI